MRLNKALFIAASFSTLGGCASLSSEKAMEVYLSVGADHAGMNYECKGEARTPVNESSQWGNQYRVMGYVSDDPSLEGARKLLGESMSKKFPKDAYQETCVSIFLTANPAGILGGTGVPVSSRSVFPQP